MALMMKGGPVKVVIYWPEKNEGARASGRRLEAGDAGGGTVEDEPWAWLAGDGPASNFGGNGQTLGGRRGKAVPVAEKGNGFPGGI